MRQLWGVLLLLFLINILRQVNAAATLSPLRLGDDNANNDIIIFYQQDGYYLQLKTSFQYLETENSFCFRLRPVVDNVDGSSCQLTNTTGDYDCLSYNQSTGNLTKWILSADYTTVSNKVGYLTSSLQGSTNIKTISIPLAGTDQNANAKFSFLAKSNSIFEMISAGSHSFYHNTNIKLNYVNTFYDSPPFLGTFSDNLIVQRQWKCFKYGTAYNVIFLGGVVRNFKQIYMISFLNWDSKGATYEMWEGLSYSKDHASRDMVGVEPSDGTVVDLLSLYASAPYADTSGNVGGVQSYSLIVSTGLSNQRVATWFYLTTIYRQYDTGDTIGDEIIRYKINNQYCFAAYYDYTASSINSDSTIVTSVDYMHNSLNCFTPDLSLQQDYMRMVVGGILTIFLLFQ